MSVQKRDLEYYLKFPYTVVVHPDPAGGYAAEIEELPGCLTQGDTLEELFEMIEDAKRGWIETRLESGLPVPEPLPAEEDFSGQFRIRIPKSLHRELARRARKEGVSLNQLVATALARAVGE